MADLQRFARRYMVPYTPWYLVGTAALLATNAMSVTIPLYLADGVDALASGVDGTDEVLYNAMAVAGMGIAVIAVRSLSRIAYFTPGRLVEAQVKRDLFESILLHQPSFLRTLATGDLFSRVSSDVNMLRLLAGFGVLSAVNAVIALFMAGGQMVRLSPELAMWLAAPIIVSMFVVQGFIRWMFVLMRRLQRQLAELSDHILASYKGVATVQGFVAEDAFRARFDALNESYLHTMLQRSQIRAGLGPTLGLGAALDVFLLLYIGGPMVIHGELTLGQLVAFTALVGFVVVPLRTSSFLLSVIKQAQASLERIDAVLYEPAERPDLPDPKEVPESAPRIRIDHLSFVYPGTDTPALQDVSLELPAGQTLGVFGATGSGKTTLLRCIARLYNPPAGSVWIDDIDVRTLDLDRWREVSTLVPQRPFLYSESVRDNILLGQEDDDLLERALQLAALKADVPALPDGVETLVGETGVRLSGGQRQRTALARGMIRRHQLLLLDDVLSAVDHATEAQLIASLRSEDRKLTTVIVAHRVSALQHADLVLVLHEGRQIDLGTPEELKNRPGPYRDTWLQQQQVHTS